jgi:hypothetical protein
LLSSFGGGGCSCWCITSHRFWLSRRIELRPEKQGQQIEELQQQTERGTQLLYQTNKGDYGFLIPQTISVLESQNLLSHSWPFFTPCL